MSWLNVWSTDPLLEFMRSKFPDCNVLARPAPGLRPLDVLAVFDDGWFQPPKHVRVGQLGDFVVGGWDAPAVALGEPADVSYSSRGTLPGAWVRRALERISVAFGVAPPAAPEQPADGAQYQVEIGGLQGCAVNVPLVLARLHNIHLREDAFRHLGTPARVLLVHSVLQAASLSVVSARDTYRISAAPGAHAGWSRHGARFELEGAPGSILTVGFSAIELHIDSGAGTWTISAGPHAQLMGDQRMPTARAWPVDVACEIEEQAGAAPTQTPGGAASGLIIPQLTATAGGMLAPAFDAGTTDLWSGGRRVGIAFVSEDGEETTEDTLVADQGTSARSMVGSTALVAKDAEGGSRVNFGARAHFTSSAWEAMKWEEGHHAIYQRARVRSLSKTTKQDSGDACDALLPRLTDVQTVKMTDGTTWGLVFFGPESAPDPGGESRRTIWQVVPGALVLPPAGEVRLEELPAAAPGHQLKALVASMDPRDVLRISECSCISRRVRQSWQLRNAPTP